VNDQIEHLRLDMHRFTSSAQFVLARINFELAKRYFTIPSINSFFAARLANGRAPQTKPFFYTKKCFSKESLQAGTVKVYRSAI
jgi:hypothetical protein